MQPETLVDAILTAEEKHAMDLGEESGLVKEGLLGLGNSAQKEAHRAEHELRTAAEDSDEEIAEASFDDVWKQHNDRMAEGRKKWVVEELTGADDDDEFEASAVEDAELEDGLTGTASEDAAPLDDAIYLETTGETARVGDFVRYFDENGHEALGEIT
jgi:hypothetical protein